MTQEHLGRQEVLDEVAKLLEDALPGDVRAIVFSGHLVRKGTDLPTMIIPSVSSDIIIECQDWNQNIRTKAKPGVIVLSILATCYAGGFVDQGVPVTDFIRLEEVVDFESLNAPILVTFSSSGSQELSYRESAIDGYDSQDRDHFLWALARTAREPSVQTWQQFVDKLRDAFAVARTMGSAAAEERPLRWMWANPQYPVFTTSMPGCLPALRTILPVTHQELMSCSPLGMPDSSSNLKAKPARSKDPAGVLTCIDSSGPRRCHSDPRTYRLDWLKQFFPGRGSKIEVALGSAAHLAGAPLRGSLYPMRPGVTVASDDTTISLEPANVVRRTPNWTTILTPPVDQPSAGVNEGPWDQSVSSTGFAISPREL
ncbi:hypothetical protein FRC12_005480 [Ceratobasidium sp. 428]|nr:hypothetical protein FRC12_005480 [Ceratobasidium sp. 428]